MVVLFFNIASALDSEHVAGTATTLKHFDYCSNIFVNVTAAKEIINSEYNLIGCNQIEPNIWNCDCHDNYDLKLNTTLYTINEYDFEIIYDYELYVKDERSSGSNYINLDVNDSIEIRLYNSPRYFKFLNKKHKIEYTDDVMYIDDDIVNDTCVLDGESIDIIILEKSKYYTVLSLSNGLLLNDNKNETVVIDDIIIEDDNTDEVIEETTDYETIDNESYDNIDESEEDFITDETNKDNVDNIDNIDNVENNYPVIYKDNNTDEKRSKVLTAVILSVLGVVALSSALVLSVKRYRKKRIEYYKLLDEYQMNNKNR